MHTTSVLAQNSVVGTVGFEILGPALARDVRASLVEGLAAGVRFPVAEGPVQLFRHELRRAIRDIEYHERGRLIQRFLRDGPRGWYEADSGDDERLSDAEAVSAVNFVFFKMINSFQGSIAEMLAVAPCQSLVRELHRERLLPRDAGLYAGEAVVASQLHRKRRDRAADFHILQEHRRRHARHVTVYGVAEVKSCYTAPSKLRLQLAKHLERIRFGVRVGDATYSGSQITACGPSSAEPFRILVMPSDWNLSRAIVFDERDGNRVLRVEPPTAQLDADRITRSDDGTWRIVLKWSHEALAAAAYEMTFWYMSKVGEVVYKTGSPWPHMTPAEAGRNAVKQMLDFASIRAQSRAQHRRAVKLFNVYGFGYPIGTSFKNEDGEREILFPQDLDEIVENGKTKLGCRIL